MFSLKMERMRVPTDSEAIFADLLDDLRQVWNPLIAPLRQAQVATLSANAGDIAWGQGHDRIYANRLRALDGELFVTHDGFIVLTLTRDERGARYKFVELPNGEVERVRAEEPELILDASFMSTGESDQERSALHDLCDRHFKSTPTPYHYPNRAFEKLSAEAAVEEIPTGPEYLKAALALSSPVNRAISIAIKAARGLLEPDAAAAIQGEGEASIVLAQLRAAGVVGAESVVVCSDTGSQVARLAEGAVLRKLAENGLKCSCGRPIDEEQAVELYSVTPVGAVLLDKSRWMSVITRERLKDAGVPDEHILLECQIGSSEIDCVALISGELTIIELKDKEFSVGNAYSFGAKISLTSPDHALIVTTASIASDVKTHFSRTQAGDPRSRDRNARHAIYYVEGVSFVEQVDAIIGEIFRGDAEKILDAALALSTPQATSVLKVLEDRHE